MAKSNVAAVQVPGEAPVIAQESESTEQTTSQTRDTTEESSVGTESAINEVQSAAPDIEALRAEIRAEEQAKARAELRDQIQEAKGELAVAEKLTKNAPTSAQGRGGYRHLRAADIDPSTLTAPALTKDGWLCPPVPEAKK